LSPRNRKTNIIKEKNSNLPVDNFISLLTVIVGQPVKDGVFVTLCAPVVIKNVLEILLTVCFMARVTDGEVSSHASNNRK